mgnify:CR=1 FL=1
MKQRHDSIDVRGVHFTIEWVPDLRDENGEKLDGVTFGAQHLIRICADLHTARRIRTLVHEYVHAVCYVTGFANILNDDLEEILAQSMEYGIMQLVPQLGREILKVATEHTEGK